jgi:hypothetical protein
VKPRWLDWRESQSVEGHLVQLQKNHFAETLTRENTVLGDSENEFF